MKILLINGSPREGNTARVLEALAARLGGHEVETLRLGELGIRGCIGCLRCQQDVEHFVCHQTGDDANVVLAKIVRPTSCSWRRRSTGIASRPR